MDLTFIKFSGLKIISSKTSFLMLGGLWRLSLQLQPVLADIGGARVIIVGCGENRELAEIGAKMAAIKLLKNNN